MHSRYIRWIMGLGGQTARDIYIYCVGRVEKKKNKKVEEQKRKEKMTEQLPNQLEQENERED